MRSFFVIMLLCNTVTVSANGFDSYCKKNIKGKTTEKQRKKLCWCVEDNLRSQLSSNDREWLQQRAKQAGHSREAASDAPSEDGQKRIKKIEFNVFKNCSENYKWKGHVDDIGVPDDVTAP